MRDRDDISAYDSYLDNLNSKDHVATPKVNLRFEVALVDENGLKRSRFSVHETIEAAEARLDEANRWCLQYRSRWYAEVRETTEPLHG